MLFTAFRVVFLALLVSCSNASQESGPTDTPATRFAATVPFVAPGVTQVSKVGGNSLELSGSIAAVDSQSGVEIVDLESGETLRRVSGNLVSFIEDGKRLATHWSDTLALLDVENGTFVKHDLKKLFGESERDIVVAPDGKSVVGYSSWGNVYFGDLTDFKSVKIYAAGFSEHKPFYSLDSKYVYIWVSRSGVSELSRFEVASKTLVELDVPLPPVVRDAFMANAKDMYVTSTSGVFKIDLSKEEPVATPVTGTMDSVRTAAVSPSGKYVAACRSESKPDLSVWEASTRKLVSTVHYIGCEPGGPHFKFSSDDSFLYFVSKYHSGLYKLDVSQSITFWGLTDSSGRVAPSTHFEVGDTGEVAANYVRYDNKIHFVETVYPFTKHSVQVNSAHSVSRLAASEDGNVVAYASGNVVKVLSRDGSLDGTFSLHKAAVSALALRSNFALSADAENRLLLWDTQKLNLMNEVSLTQSVLEIRLSQDGAKALMKSTSASGTELALWDVQTLTKIRSVQTVGLDTRFDVTPSFTFVATRLDDGIMLSNLETGSAQLHSGLADYIDGSEVFALTPDAKGVFLYSPSRKKLSLYSFGKKKVVETFDDTESAFTKLRFVGGQLFYGGAEKESFRIRPISKEALAKL